MYLVNKNKIHCCEIYYVYKKWLQKYYMYANFLYKFYIEYVSLSEEQYLKDMLRWKKNENKINKYLKYSDFDTQ